MHSYLHAKPAECSLKNGNIDPTLQKCSTKPPMASP